MTHGLDTPRQGTSRRRFLTGAAGAVGVAAAAGAGFGAGRATDAEAGPAPERIPFYGAHQAGIATPAQDRLAFAAFDLTTRDHDSIQRTLGLWSAAAARMTAGEPVGTVDTAPNLPPVDTGEALGLGPARLTVTVGFGASFFDKLGLGDRKPGALIDIPALPGDALQPARTGGDLCVQACADDPQVAFHAVRNFARLARGTAVIRWSQLGFGRTSSTSTTQATPRNLMGFKDGTNNIKAESSADLDTFVWVDDETDQPWLRGGTHLVARRIRMLVESWDTDGLADQQNVFGRAKSSGAPLTGTHEFDTPDLTAKHPDGSPVIPVDAHIRLAAPASNGGQKILRRGYSYTDGIDPDTGLLDAGLFFIAFQQNAHAQFVRIQHQLGQHDALNEYIRHTGSGLFAVPPGLSGPGDWFGKALFD